MKYNKQQFEKDTQSFKNNELTPAHRDYLKSEVMRYAEQHPVFIKTHALKKKVAIFITGLLVITTGTAFASENSLPGDSLYTIKVDVIEPVIAALKVDTQAKADYQSSLADKRLAELQTLVNEKKTIDESAILKHYALFEGHVEKSENHNKDNSSIAVVKTEMAMDSAMRDVVEDEEVEPQAMTAQSVRMDVTLNNQDSRILLYAEIIKDIPELQVFFASEFDNSYSGDSMNENYSDESLLTEEDHTIEGNGSAILSAPMLPLGSHEELIDETFDNSKKTHTTGTEIDAGIDIDGALEVIDGYTIDIDDIELDM